MKKGLAVFILLCLLIGSWVSIGLAAGSWTSSSYNAPKNTVIKTISLTFTADSGDAGIPVYTFTAADLAFVTGNYLYAVETDPGATGPTNGVWDVTIKNVNGYEITGNSCDNLSSTATQVNLPMLNSNIISPPIVDGTAITITIEENAVVSATATIKLFFTPNPPPIGSTGSSGIAMADLYVGGVAVSTSNPVPVKNVVFESDVIELIGADEAVEASHYAGSVGFPFSATASTQQVSFCLFSSEAGTGAVQTPGLTLMFFDADPSITANDAALAAGGAEHVTIVGTADIEASEWNADASGAVMCSTVSINVHSISTLYVTARLDAASAYNDAAGDDEKLRINIWYQ